VTALQAPQCRREARLPFGPLEQLVSGGCGLATARELGVHPRQVYRWRRYGVTWAQADELATRAGWHPAEVWGADWWDAEPILDVRP
jgi:hypothetical protein